MVSTVPANPAATATLACRTCRSHLFPQHVQYPVHDTSLKELNSAGTHRPECRSGSSATGLLVLDERAASLAVSTLRDPEWRKAGFTGSEQTVGFVLDFFYVSGISEKKNRRNLLLCAALSTT